MTLWLDVEDLFEYARAVARPSGIQRLSYEMYAALSAVDPAGVRFVRTDAMDATMRTVGWEQVERIFARMTQARLPASPRRRPVAATSLMHSRLGRMKVLRAAAQRMPREVRQPLGAAMQAQLSTFRNLATSLRAVPTAVSAHRAATRQAAEIPSAQHGQDLREVAQPGDTLASFGSPWSLPEYPGLVERMRREAGLRYAVLVYDMIPVIRPEYCDSALVQMFTGFARGCLPQADTLLAISEATVRDTVAWSTREGIALRTTPRAIPIGTGFTHTTPPSSLPEGLVAGGYALFVSTVEARKNHVLAFRAWRRLLDELPRERVPTLVFAGRIGWMVADLMQQIDNAASLDGKLVIVEDPDDATLAALYAGARFTLFPSLYEGWGLPVSESLSFGKVCLASSGTSVPEAGGDFCLYHDPDSVTDAVALYRRVIEQPAVVTELEARIAAEYRPVPWSATARAVLDAIG